MQYSCINPVIRKVYLLFFQQESQYILQQDFDYNLLVQFINNYTHNLLPRNLRSQSRVQSRARSEREHECNVSDSSVICVPELTTDTFLDTVLDPEKVTWYFLPATE